MASEREQITRILGEIRDGKPEAADQLMEAVYSDLRSIARRFFSSERPDHTLQPTALVHEAYLKIFSGSDVDWRDRRHFYAIAARQMRRILIDNGRAFRAQRRGGGAVVSLDEALHASKAPSPEFDEINDLLDRLERTDPTAARVIEMKFYSGMTDEEVAGELKCSPATVRRHWIFGKTWLAHRMPDRENI